MQHRITAIPNRIRSGPGPRNSFPPLSQTQLSGCALLLGMLSSIQLDWIRRILNTNLHPIWRGEVAIP